MKRRLILCLVPALVVYLSGCASSQQALYAWGSYETQVYAYLQEGKSPEAQIEALERDQEKIEASGKTALPGFYAHLGMLYANVGNDAKAIACFVTEKTRFPEATPFMDFLLKKYQK
ncbi:MAG: DUF4810 domain-containing protein [Zoogloeaceae bacterium]|nr:DUF4810 domain-containing protein [Zoogloeaceae bacterium]